MRSPAPYKDVGFVANPVQLSCSAVNRAGVKSRSAVAETLIDSLLPDFRTNSKLGSIT